MQENLPLNLTLLGSNLGVAFGGENRSHIRKIGPWSALVRKGPFLGPKRGGDFRQGSLLRKLQTGRVHAGFLPQTGGFGGPELKAIS